MPITEPVTLQEAKRHCRIDHDTEDELITTYITAAREWAEGFLNVQLVPSDENSDPIEVKQTYKQAILLLVGHWYTNRENTTASNLKDIPLGVKDLLWLDRNVPV
ncbi:MAG: phage gp6-like head-tail connector protein [Synergistaceae bacterium]|nr:phage gp6-like head-tail connector protein [Synergistaceae bacterium]